MRPIDIVTSTGRSSLTIPLSERGASVRVIGADDSGRPGAVRVMRTKGTGKLMQLTKLSVAGVPTVPFTTSRTAAQQLVDNGSVVFARTLLNSSRGKGIAIIDGGTVPQAPLYTTMVLCHREWRCHYAFGKTAAVKKLLRNGAVPSLIRNRKNGYVFSSPRNHDGVEQLGARAIRALGYDFGAVDIIESPDGGLHVLEVNRAPGIKSPSAHTFYVNAIIEEAQRGE